MKRLLTMFALASLCAAAPAPAAGPAAPLLVTPAWLAEHLRDPGLVVLHVASLRRDYDAGHVPGARFLWSGDVAQGTPDMTFEVLPASRLRRAFDAAGVSDDSHVVLCGAGGSLALTARVLVTLEHLGRAGRVSVLDGGLDAWKSDGREVSRQAAEPRRGALRPQVDRGVIVDAAWVQSARSRPGVSIVDARARNFFDGAGAGQPRAGHIAGAVSIPSSSLVDSTNRLLPAARLAEVFERAGVPAGNEVAAYCHVGQQACVVYLAARALGRVAHLYDGSFDDWSGRPELPVETTARPDTLRR